MLEKKKNARCKKPAGKAGTNIIAVKYFAGKYDGDKN
ncbi:MAG: hypothetical protein G01um101418_299 [Parcubacteria group bacterium Gr01-1014_18]|nr:MAG: hypothetical protein Greene041636_325 [Parcubacteria group bacterium Greene0416_36]TSC81159.1 MAG: hypothetical protein G01um101418_299 [Parcubacteria group bacterium Gr01-1014_18]TSC99156.1 MAG: hypothetical protein Greene101420_301 [Parcubacteria group bacterium Greene1014_20]TSD07486.1 MAG: hypothetical protein Greene07142_185 [Parcubacteria group bacterium Greene0714_2]